MTAPPAPRGMGALRPGTRPKASFTASGPEDLRIISIPTPGSFTFVNPPSGATLDGGYVGNSAEADVDNSGGPRDGDVYVATESRQLRGFDVGGESLPNFPIPFAGNICGVSVDNEGFVWVGTRAPNRLNGSTPRTETWSNRSASATPASPAGSRSTKETATSTSTRKTARSGSTRKRAATPPTSCLPKTPACSPSTRPKGSSTTSGPATEHLHPRRSAPPMANRSRKSKP